MVQLSNMQQLKEETLTSHERLESHPTVKKIFDEESHEEYFKFIECMKIHWQKVDSALDAFNEKFSDSGEFRHFSKHLISCCEKDLQTYKNKFASKPEPIELQIGRFEELMGLLYTMVGSCLGAKVIVKRIEKFPPEIKNYFSYASQHGFKIWNLVRANIQEIAPEKVALAISTSNDVFDSIYQSIDSGNKTHE